MFKKIIVFLVLSVVINGCGLLPETYSAASITGRVIDEENEQPVEGAHVIVYWQLYKGGYAGRYPTDILKVEETITDKDGRYHFDGWGPVVAIAGDLGYQAPELLLFKAGYYYKHLSNSQSQIYFGAKGASEIHIPATNKADVGLVYVSQWDNKIIKLTKYKNDIDKVLNNLYWLGSDISIILRGKGCESLQIRKLYTNYSQYISSRHLNNYPRTFYTIENGYDEGCGEVIKVYQGRMK